MSFVSHFVPPNVQWRVFKRSDLSDAEVVNTRKPLDERVGQFKDIEDEIRAKYRLLAPWMDERVLRLWGGAEAVSIGQGGIAVVHRATGMSRNRVSTGIKELTDEETRKMVATTGAIRRRGAGRPTIIDDPELIEALKSLLEDSTRGDPESPLRWSSKSIRKLTAELKEQGHDVSHTSAKQILVQQGYSMKGTRKTVEGKQHPDRDDQFKHINQTVQVFMQAGLPVVSVDTKKKELVGNFANGGREWTPPGEEPRVKVHDFPSDAQGKAIPYGVYDVGRNEAWVSVGQDHDTAEFAVATIEQWWTTMGQQAYGDADAILIVADGGGSNGSRIRLWKKELQDWADRTGMAFTVCHFPPGTSKWNKIEHRLFSQITKNWRGKPLVSYETIVSLIANTTTSTGLKVRAAIDGSSYETGIKVPDEEMSGLSIIRDDFHGDWNYTIMPRDDSMDY